MIFFPDIKIFVDQSTQRRRCGEQPSSRGNGVMCKVAFAPAAPPAGQRLHKLCPTHSAKPQHKTLRLQLGKKRGNPQRIRGLKGLPVIMANGSNLVGGVNELVVSVLAAQFEPQDDHLAGRPLSSPQTGPSSETHQHSALFGRFFLGLATFFACCSMLLHFFSIQMVHCGFFFLVFPISLPVVSCVGSLSLGPPAALSRGSRPTPDQGRIVATWPSNARLQPLHFRSSPSPPHGSKLSQYCPLTKVQSLQRQVDQTCIVAKWSLLPSLAS